MGVPPALGGAVTNVKPMDYFSTHHRGDRDMAAYALFRNLSVNDAEGLAKYRANVPAIVAAFGGRYLVRGGAWDTIEGPADVPPILIEFASMDAINKWYHSKEYRSWRDLRHRSAKYYAIFMDGYNPPKVVED